VQDLRAFSLAPSPADESRKSNGRHVMSTHAYRNHKHDQTWQGYQLIHAGTKLMQSFQVPALAVVKLQQL